MARSWIRMLHQLLEVPAGGQLLVLFHCAKVGSTVGAVRIEAHSFPWCQRVKKKIYFQNVYFWLFESRLVSASFSQGTESKITTFLESAWKMSTTVPTFHLSVTLSSGNKFDLKIGKISSKTMFFRWSTPTKSIQWP